MSSSANNPHDHKLIEDLAYTQEEMASTNQQSFPSAPPIGLPPSYSNNESIEMRNLGPHFNPPPGPPPAGPQDQPTSDPGDRGFAFYKPQKDPRTKLYVGMLVFLTIGIMILATVLGLTILSHKKEAAIPLPHSTTISMISTTLVSTETLSFTVTAVSASTQVTTQTRTLTSLLPDPLSVPNCWVLLQDVCANTSQVPSLPDFQTGLWGQCQEIFGFFYCDVMTKLENQHYLIIPADLPPFCGRMKYFCDNVDLGFTVTSQAPATRTSPILQLITPVSKRGFVDTTPGHKVMQLSRIHHPTGVSGPLPTVTP